jgi:chemotaxis protein MotB
MGRVVMVAGCMLLFSSCLVSKKKFDEQVALADKYATEKNDCNDKLNAANALNQLLNDSIGGLNNTIAGLQNELAFAKKQKADGDKVYDNLKKRFDDLLSSSSKEKNNLSQALNDKETELNKKASELDNIASELAAKQKRIDELEALISKKDQAVAALKKKISDALTGFNSSELTVTQKDGKVYVSLSDKLLFKSGSYTVDVRGKQALSKLAEVLNKQTEIGIMVEGHTDNKPYGNTSGTIKNNWDLSVMRASTVATILVEENKVDPKRVVPAGHGEFLPVDNNDSTEGRSKNRRIEIVLSPDLGEIFKILDSVK